MNTKKRFSNYFGILSLVCLMTVFSGLYLSKFQAYLSKGKATVIIESLNKFKTIHDHYPENLTELVPEYLENIPNSMMGWFDEPYEYFKRENGGFEITFPSYGGGYFITSGYSNGNWIETD